MSQQEDMASRSPPVLAPNGQGEAEPSAAAKARMWEAIRWWPHMPSWAHEYEWGDDWEDGEHERDTFNRLFGAALRAAPPSPVDREAIASILCNRESYAAKIDAIFEAFSPSAAPASPAVAELGPGRTT